jgi:hypothetical protein
MNPAGRMVKQPLLVGVLLLSVCLNVYHVWWGLPLRSPVARQLSPGASLASSRGEAAQDQEDVVVWGNDEVAPMGPLVYVKRTFIDRSWSHKYPAFHFMVLSVAYAPYLTYLILTGQLSLARLSEQWPYGLTEPMTALTTMVLIARLLSVVMGTAIVGLIYFVTRRLFGSTPALFAALIVIFCFPFIYYSHTSNVDIPYLFWFTLGFYFYVRLLAESRTPHYLLLGMCLALAVATKDQAYGLLPFLPLALLWFRLGEQQRSGQTLQLGQRLARLPWRQLGLAGAAFAITYVLAANLLINWHGFVRHLRYITDAGSSPYQEFTNTVAGHLGLLSKTVTLLARSWGIPVFTVCSVGLLWGLVRFRRVSLALLAPTLSYYLFFIAMILYVYPRFVLPFVLILAIFGGKLLGDLWATSARLSWVTRPCIAILLLYSLIYGASADWLFDKDPRYQAEDWINRHVPPQAIIETYGPIQYLPRFPEHVHVRLIPLEGYVEDAFRTRAPEYVLLTHAYYRRITEDQEDDFDQEELIEGLWNGKLGYSLAGDFKASGVIAPDLIRSLNPRIVIFERGQP